MQKYPHSSSKLSESEKAVNNPNQFFRRSNRKNTNNTLQNKENVSGVQPKRSRGGSSHQSQKSSIPVFYNTSAPASGFDIESCKPWPDCDKSWNFNGNRVELITYQQWRKRDEEGQWAWLSADGTTVFHERPKNADKLLIRRLDARLFKEYFERVWVLEKTAILVEPHLIELIEISNLGSPTKGELPILAKTVERITRNVLEARRDQQKNSEIDGNRRPLKRQRLEGSNVDLTSFNVSTEQTSSTEHDYLDVFNEFYSDDSNDVNINLSPILGQYQTFKVDEDQDVAMVEQEQTDPLGTLMTWAYRFDLENRELFYETEGKLFKNTDIDTSLSYVGSYKETVDNIEEEFETWLPKL